MVRKIFLILFAAEMFLKCTTENEMYFLLFKARCSNRYRYIFTLLVTEQFLTEVIKNNFCSSSILEERSAVYRLI